MALAEWLRRAKIIECLVNSLEEKKDLTMENDGIHTCVLGIPRFSDKLLDIDSLLENRLDAKKERDEATLNRDCVPNTLEGFLQLGRENDQFTRPKKGTEPGGSKKEMP